MLCVSVRMFRFLLCIKMLNDVKFIYLCINEFLFGELGVVKVIVVMVL